MGAALKILFLAHRLPYPPDKGEKIRAYHLLRFLSKGHRIWLASLAWSPKEVRDAEQLSSLCEQLFTVRMRPLWAKIRCLPTLLSSDPLTLPYFRSARMGFQVRRWLRNGQFDLVLAFSSSMAQYAMARTLTPKVMELVDVDSDKWTQYAKKVGFPLSAIYAREGRRLQSFEARVAQSFDRCTVVSEAEQRIFQTAFKGCTAYVVPNGVDHQHFRPRGGRRQANSLVFVGTMSYFPNVDAVLYFCNQILPLIRRHIPQVNFLIVGRNPTRGVRRLCTRKGIQVIGAVPDIRVYLERAMVFVAPLRIAPGVQNKILQAMAMGVPVVCTSQAVQGIQAQAGHDLMLADTPQDFAVRTVELLLDRQKWESLSRNGRRTVVERYDWDVCLGKFEEVLMGLKSR